MNYRQCFEVVCGIKVKIKDIDPGFKQLSAEEATHDILWRIHPAAPTRGQVAIFNRFHYEEDFADKALAALRYEIGGHKAKAAEKGGAP